MALNLNAIGQVIGPVTREFDWKDMVLYALGVGAGFDELEYVYENQLKVIPSFAILTIYDFFQRFHKLVRSEPGRHPARRARPDRAQPDPTGRRQSLPVKVASPPCTTRGRERGAGRRRDRHLPLRGAEALHQRRHPVLPAGRRLWRPAGPRESFAYPDRPPDYEEMDHPSPDQPLIYRLSGDTFALHVDPDFAAHERLRTADHARAVHATVSRAGR